LKAIEILPRRSLVKTVPRAESEPVVRPKRLRTKRPLSPQFARAIAELEFAVAKRGAR